MYQRFDCNFSLGTNVEAGVEREDVKEPPPIPPADGDASPGDGGTWEDVAEDNDPILTPDEEEPSSEELPKLLKKKLPKAEESTKNKKEHVNVVFIGHVDAGKSTIGGQIMALTGMVDKRTLEKYEREAREKSRESWYLSWALDTNQEGKSFKIMCWNNRYSHCFYCIFILLRIKRKCCFGSSLVHCWVLVVRYLLV